MRLFVLIALLLLSLPQAFAGICDDPNMTDDERSDIISRSLEDAVACMGEDWVYGDLEPMKMATSGLDVDVDVDARRMRFVDPNGKLQTWLISPGIGGVTTTQCRNCTKTLIGQFEGPYRTEGANYVVQDESKDYIGAPMPWAVFYAKDTGWAIHGTYAVGQLGSPASHGCIRVATANARQFNYWVNLSNDASVKINVHGTGRGTVPARPRVQRRAPAPEYAPPPQYYPPQSYYPRPPMDVGPQQGYYPRPFGW